jgi:hypothetical protein
MRLVGRSTALRESETCCNDCRRMASAKLLSLSRATTDEILTFG